VPRGGKSLVARVQDEARVPVFAHLEGICHTYVHRGGRSLDMAIAHRRQRQDAPHRRVRRDGDAAGRSQPVAPAFCRRSRNALAEAGCALRGDDAARAIDARHETATEEDWRTEYLDAIISVKRRRRRRRRRDRAHRALRLAAHRAIVTEDAAAAERFLRASTSAIVLHNASTQFADGGEFGFGGEIGIATGQDARARARRRRAAHHVQIRRARQRPDPPVIPRPRSESLAYPGMKIGLFGGSFDPAHEGHAHVSRDGALKRLGLDRVWWLVSPQNPLKPLSSPIRTIASHSAQNAMAQGGAKMVVTDLEQPARLRDSPTRRSGSSEAALSRRVGSRSFWARTTLCHLPQMAKLARGRPRPPGRDRRPPRRGRPQLRKTWRAQGLDLPECPAPHFQSSIGAQGRTRKRRAVAKPAPEVIAFPLPWGRRRNPRFCRLK
jgi:hypothetical protein